MLTDIEISNQAKPQPITAIANQFGLLADEITAFGDVKAKVEPRVLSRLLSQP